MKCPSVCGLVDDLRTHADSDELGADLYNNSGFVLGASHIRRGLQGTPSSRKISLVKAGTFYFYLSEIFKYSFHPSCSVEQELSGGQIKEYTLFLQPSL